LNLPRVKLDLLTHINQSRRDAGEWWMMWLVDGCRSCSCYRRRTMTGGALGVLTDRKATCRPTTSRRLSRRSCRRLSSGRWKFPSRWRLRRVESAKSWGRKRLIWDALLLVCRIVFFLWK